MAIKTVSIRERLKDPLGRWRWSQNLRPPDDSLKPSEADRKGKFYLVWTEGKKHEQRVKGNFEAAIKAARAKERHLEDAADGFDRPDPLKKKAERITIADAIDARLHSVEVTFERDTLKSHRQALRQFEKWTARHFVNETCGTSTCLFSSTVFQPPLSTDRVSEPFSIQSGRTTFISI